MMTGTRGIVAAGVLGTAVAVRRRQLVSRSSEIRCCPQDNSAAPTSCSPSTPRIACSVDADDTYYDPADYTDTGAVYEAAIGLHRRGLQRGNRNIAASIPPGVSSTPDPSNDKYQADSIAAMGDAEAGYATFYERTRLAVARKALIQAITDNATSRVSPSSRRGRPGRPCRPPATRVP